MNVFTTVADDHIFHHSTDADPIENQPNRTFAHLTAWFEHCSICERLLPQREAVA